MSDWTYAIVVEARAEWTVPTHEPWGACWNQVQQAITDALCRYRELWKLPDDAVVPNDAIRYHPRDDAIVISCPVPPEVVHLRHRRADLQ